MLIKEKMNIRIINKKNKCFKGIQLKTTADSVDTLEIKLNRDHLSNTRARGLQSY